MGCHFWNPLLALLIMRHLLIEGYGYDRQSSILILKTYVYAYRILSSLGSTSKMAPNVGSVCI